MTTDATLPATQSIVVPFDDNRLAAELFGEYDANLAMLEERLEVNAVAHGNVVTLHGTPGACQTAKHVLESLYARLERGESVTAGDIDGAIRHAGPVSGPGPGGNGGSPEEGTRSMAQVRTRKRLITARTPMQSAYMNALEKEELIFATGPAGTGKTYLAVAYAAAALERGEADRLILSRPAVEAGERLGFLPGDMRDKVDPYLRPLYDALYDMLPAEQVAKKLETGEIEVAPLAFMRGRTLANAYVILDEAQNTTTVQMKMLLTRLGENSRMAITGDLSQIDLPRGTRSGLREALEVLQDVEGIAFTSFDARDVVRHPMVTRIVRAYASHEQAELFEGSEKQS